MHSENKHLILSESEEDKNVFPEIHQHLREKNISVEKHIIVL